MVRFWYTGILVSLHRDHLDSARHRILFSFRFLLLSFQIVAKHNFNSFPKGYIRIRGFAKKTQT